MKHNPKCVGLIRKNWLIQDGPLPTKHLIYPFNKYLLDFWGISRYLQVGKVKEASYAKSWSSERDLEFRDNGENMYKIQWEHQGLKWIHPVRVSRKASRQQRTYELHSCVYKLPCKPLIPKKSSKVQYIKHSIPLISNQWENSWGISVRVWMQSSGPNLLAEKQWSIPTCTVEKVWTILPSASHPGMELAARWLRDGGSRVSLLWGHHGGRTCTQFIH